MRVPKMAELVAGHLRRQIVRGELHEGDALPPETILMEQFGVSRPTLREAFRILESEALISVRRGARGGRVSTHPTATWPLAIRDWSSNTATPPWPTCTRPAASSSRSAPACWPPDGQRGDLDRLYAAVESGEAVLEEDPDLFIRIHTEFHALVVELAGNETLKVVTGIVRHIVDTANWNRVAEEPHGPSTRRATHKGARAHRRVVELIEAKDIEGAEALWRKHLVEADQYLLESPPGKTILDLLD